MMSHATATSQKSAFSRAPRTTAGMPKESGRCLDNPEGVKSLFLIFLSIFFHCKEFYSPLGGGGGIDESRADLWNLTELRPVTSPTGDVTCFLVI